MKEGAACGTKAGGFVFVAAAVAVVPAAFDCAAGKREGA